MPEITPTGILYKYNQTGELPKSMIPVHAFNATPEDPTKPLRSSLDSILLARSGVRALRDFDVFWTEQKQNPANRPKMMPIIEIDRIQESQRRKDVLDEKVEFTLDSFQTLMRKALVYELEPKNRLLLPKKVKFAYGLLLQLEGVQETADGIMEAGISLSEQMKDLFFTANTFYGDFLGYEASTRQIVDLVGNSYDTATHYETGFHNAATEQTGTYYDIATIGGIDRIFVLDSSYHHRIEKEMRARGEIKDQSTHCPFAMNSRFTNPFQDTGVEVVDGNPLKMVFEALVRKYIGS